MKLDTKSIKSCHLNNGLVTDTMGDKKKNSLDNIDSYCKNLKTYMQRCGNIGNSKSPQRRKVTLLSVSKSIFMQLK